MFYALWQTSAEPSVQETFHRKWVLAAHRWVETDGQTGGWSFKPGKGVVNFKNYTAAAMQGVWPSRSGKIRQHLLGFGALVSAVVTCLFI